MENEVNVFFDLDGTLIDVSKRHFTVYKELVTKYGGIPLEKISYWDLKRNKTAWSEILSRSSISKEITVRFLDDFINKIEDTSYLKEDILFPDVVYILEDIARVADLYLVSLRRNSDNLKAELEWLGIEHLFKDVLTGHSETDGHDVKVELIGKINNGDKSFIVGDTEADIISGKELSLITVAVLSGLRDEKFLAALKPDFIISNISELKSIVQDN